jgi:hypothetical protein
METLETGDFAYFDAFDGLIPCRVTQIAGTSGIASMSQTVTAIITVTKGAWRKGEQIMSSGLRTVPRGAVHQSSGQYRIRAYHVVAS